MISYVLLIAFAIVMGGVIYQWMKTYVPKNPLECPDGVSIFIKEVICTDEGGNFNLNLGLKNNGRFDVAGYFIYSTENELQELATVDLSKYLEEGGEKFGSAIILSPESENLFKIDSEENSVFNLDNKTYSIEVIPVRFQTEENKKRLISCGDAKIKEKVICE